MAYEMRMTKESIEQNFPLFECDEAGKNKNGEQIFQVFYNPQRTHSIWLHNPFTLSDILSLEEMHSEARLKMLYLIFYPDLHLAFEDGQPDHAWIRREGRDGEGIGQVAGVDLNALQQLACAAKQPEHFWCTGCQQPHHNSEYAYFYFAGKYCKTWKDEHPGHYKRAMSEDYS